MTEKNTPLSARTEFILISLIMLISLGMRLLYLPKNGLDYDEGHWLMFGTLAAKGYTAYTEIFVGIAPLGLNTLKFSAMLFGSELTVRLPMILYSLLGVWAMYRLVKWQVSPLAGLLAAILLSFQAHYFLQSVSVMTEVPAVALALLAVVLVEKFSRSRRRGWLVLAGAITAASLLLKVFVILLPPLIGLQLLVRHLTIDPLTHRSKLNLGQFFMAGLIWLLGVMLAILPFLIIYDPAAMYTEILQFRFLLREAKYVQEGVTAASTLVLVMTSLWDSLAPLLLTATLGVIMYLRSQPGGIKAIWLWPAWFILALLTLVIQIPFRERYVVMLVPPLAALTGIGITQLGEWLTTRWRPKRQSLTAGIGLGLVFLVMLVTPIQAITSPPEESWLDVDDISRRAAATFVHRISAPDDCIVVDDQRFAFLAGRLVPPWLSETSDARFQVGWLTSKVIAETIAKNDCVALVYISGRFGSYLPDLAAKAADIFALELAFSDSEDSRFTTVYAIPFQLQKTPDIALNYSLGDQALLKGVDVTPGPWAANQEISLSTWWQATQPMLKDYKIFVHIIDAANQTVATFDHYPYETKPDDYLWSVQPTNVDLFDSSDTVEKFKNYPAAGLLPTRFWPVGQTIKETLTVRLPDSLPTGNYTVTLGLYDESTGERLPMQQDGVPAENNEATIRNILIPLVPFAVLGKKEKSKKDDGGQQFYSQLIPSSFVPIPENLAKLSFTPGQASPDNDLHKLHLPPIF